MNTERDLVNDFCVGLQHPTIYGSGYFALQVHTVRTWSPKHSRTRPPLPHPPPPHSRTHPFRFGRVFKPGARIKVSTIPVIVATVPIIVVLAALLAIRLFCKSPLSVPVVVAVQQGTGVANSSEIDVVEVPNPLQMHNNPLAKRRSMESMRRRQTLTRERNGRGLMRHLFRIETPQLEMEDSHSHASDASGATNRHCCCLRRPWQRLLWSSLKNSHELLAIFLAKRTPDMGANERLVVFLACLESQLVAVTLLYYLHVCYELGSIFDEDSMPLYQLIEGRLAMVILTVLVTLPIDLLVSVALAVNKIQFATTDEHMCASCPGCRRNFQDKTSKRCRGCLRHTPWAVLASVIVISSAAIVLLTSADHNSDDNAPGAQTTPCNCRISHNDQQPLAWLLMIVAQTFFWLCVSRPFFIVLGVLGGRCNRKRRRWSDARALRRASAASVASMGRRSTGGNDIEMVSTSNVVGTPDGAIPQPQGMGAEGVTGDVQTDVCVSSRQVSTTLDFDLSEEDSHDGALAVRPRAKSRVKSGAYHARIAEGGGVAFFMGKAGQAATAQKRLRKRNSAKKRKKVFEVETTGTTGVTVQQTPGITAEVRGDGRTEVCVSFRRVSTTIDGDLSEEGDSHDGELAVRDPSRVDDNKMEEV